MGWSQGLFRALWRALSREVKEHVGTDQLGNKYYYIPEYKNWRGEVRARAAVACLD
uniref:NADH:ubiquinone oxidoreductase complex assembly factor 2 n=1 Tax=Propithecus coquereli TaxID=379532 RepID=A0A2K6H0Z9_PROCO